MLVINDHLPFGDGRRRLEWRKGDVDFGEPQREDQRGWSKKRANGKALETNPSARGRG